MPHGPVTIHALLTNNNNNNALFIYPAPPCQIMLNVNLESMHCSHMSKEKFTNVYKVYKCQGKCIKHCLFFGSNMIKILPKTVYFGGHFEFLLQIINKKCF